MTAKTSVVYKQAYMTTYSPGALGISEFHWWYVCTKTQASSPGFIELHLSLKNCRTSNNTNLLSMDTVSRYTKPKYFAGSLCCYSPLSIKFNAMELAHLKDVIQTLCTSS